MLARNSLQPLMLAADEARISGPGQLSCRSGRLVLSRFLFSIPLQRSRLFPGRGVDVDSRLATLLDRVDQLISVLDGLGESSSK